jgi:hypothetical protein
MVKVNYKKLFKKLYPPYDSANYRYPQDHKIGCNCEKCKKVRKRRIADAWRFGTDKLGESLRTHPDGTYDEGMPVYAIIYDSNTGDFITEQTSGRK